ncbi:LON peptidase substrate-binding domain-containing protein [Vibrio scophthalmi]|uniref:LON peptidase substrate-binding domain-containing protein n=1 Tax=Vibrio scophthalmi TaxID=45658 RepID=UPI002FF31D2C
MKLRIFEPRYKRLVSDAMKGDGTFGICLLERVKQPDAVQLSHTGSLVRIVDFDQLDDGLLGITVCGLQRFTIERVRTEFDGLRMAKIRTLPNWQVAEMSPADVHLGEHLLQVYHDYPQVGELYQQRFMDDASWVTQRWLELLPLTPSRFDSLNQQQTCEAALAFINQMIPSPQP